MSEWFTSRADIQPHIGTISVSFLVELFRGLFELDGDDGLSCGLSGHVASGASACDTGLFEALDVVTYECGVDDVLAGLAAELAGVVLHVQCHESEIPFI